MATSPKTNTPVTTVSAKILSITIDSKITACLGDTPVTLPNWEQDVELKDGAHYKRPGVFGIGYRNKQSKLKVKFKATGLTRDIEATLTGVLGNPDAGGVKFEGTIKSGADLSTPTVIEVVPVKEPTHFKRIQGNMKWSFSFKNAYACQESIELEETPMEIFWIYGYPGKMYKKGVWIEVLRLLDVECGGLTEKLTLIRRVVNFCHSGVGVRYDSYHYASYYGMVRCGGAFDLKAYMEKVHPLCNCFDQAGALQTFLGALGIKVEYAIIEPFGYLLETNLVGRGTCNSPGFLSTLDLPAPEMQVEVLPRDDCQRDAFGIHTFCIWNNEGYDIILDACSGPHFSYDIKKTFVDGFKQSYINETIDAQANLYGNDSNDFVTSPGKISDIDTGCEGVIDVHGIGCSPFDDLQSLSPREQKKIRDFEKNTHFKEAGKDIPPLGKGVVCKWQNPFDLSGLRDVSWARKFEDSRSGIDISLKEWSLIGANEYINVQVYVAKTIESAKNRLIILTLSSTMPKVLLKPKPQPLGHLHLQWYSPYFIIEEWWFYNTCIKITAFNPSIDLNKLANDLHETAKENVKLNLPDWYPVIEDVLITTSADPPVPGRINVGEEVIIKVHPKPDPDRNPPDVLKVDFFFPKGNGVSGEHLRLVKESAVTIETGSDKDKIFELRFEGRSPGITDIQLVLVNRETLLISDPYGIAVNVVK